MSNTSTTSTRPVTPGNEFAIERKRRYPVFGLQHVDDMKATPALAADLRARGFDATGFYNTRQEGRGTRIAYRTTSGTWIRVITAPCRIEPSDVADGVVSPNGITLNKAL